VRHLDLDAADERAKVSGVDRQKCVRSVKLICRYWQAWIMSSSCGLFAGRMPGAMRLIAEARRAADL
jgi:TctA family transporter